MQHFSEKQLIDIRGQNLNDEAPFKQTVVKLCNQCLDNVEVKGQFTDDEKKILLLSAELWNKYLQLPVQHQNDRYDFSQAIHELQRIIGWRPMTRSGYLDT